MQIKITICDICKDSQRTTREYTVTAEGRSGITDRCEEHAIVLEEILQGMPEPRPRAAPKPKSKSPEPSPRGRRSRVVDISEVQAARR